jgi:tousled-like kinase
VWRAFDLHEGRYVACKIHRIRRDWPAQTRDNYMRHAKRELDIQKKLNHPHLTQLHDVFEMDSMDLSAVAAPHPNGGAASLLLPGHQQRDIMFVSVMEYSAGDDLDTHLKRLRTMKEADARVVLMQIVSALRAMAEQQNPIIHYDLKPANIIFHSSLPSCLDVKVLDFGLSKVVVSSGTAGQIELTSQGVGTYWYLPPECFVTNGPPPLISHKVDIWAAGVIFYQMLYGKKPFADGESQRAIWQQKLINKQAVSALDFPEKPAVSVAAKELMRRCLSFDQDQRPDIFALSNDPYFRSAATGVAAAAAARRRMRSATGAMAASGSSPGNAGAGPGMPPPPAPMGVHPQPYHPQQQQY